MTATRTDTRLSATTKAAAPLVLVAPSYSGLEPILVGSGKYLVGSAPECSIRLQVDGIHDRHAMILVGERRIVLKALDPRTWLNDCPVTEMALRAGDRLSVGPLTFRVRAATNEDLVSLVPAVRPSSTESRLQSAPLNTSEPKPALPVNAAPRPHFDAPGSSPDVEERRSPADRPVESLDSKIEEIQKYLGELDLSSHTDNLTNAPVTAAKSPESKSGDQAVTQPDLRADFQHRLDAISRQTKLLEERTARVIEREAEARRQSLQLETEAQRLAAVTDVARRSLSDEHARQLTQWQEWDATYRRMSGELATQFEMIEQQRTAVQAEADRLASSRVELEKQRIECERIQRECVADRARVASETAEYQKQRAAADAELQKRLFAIQERESQLARDRSELVRGREEVLAAQQKIEGERAALIKERLAQESRFEHEVLDYSTRQARLDAERIRMQAERKAIVAIYEEVEQERAAMITHRARSGDLERELVQMKSRLEQTDEELAGLKRERQINQSSFAALREQHSFVFTKLEEEQARARIDLALIESLRRDLEAERRALESERSKAEAAQAELREYRNRQEHLSQISTTPPADVDAYTLPQSDLPAAELAIPIVQPAPSNEAVVESASEVTESLQSSDWNVTPSDELLEQSETWPVSETSQTERLESLEFRQPEENDRDESPVTTSPQASTEWASVSLHPGPTDNPSCSTEDDVWGGLPTDVGLDYSREAPTVETDQTSLSVSSDPWLSPSTLPESSRMDQADAAPTDIPTTSSLDVIRDAAGAELHSDDESRAEQSSAEVELESVESESTTPADVGQLDSLDEVTRQLGVGNHEESQGDCAQEKNALPSWWTSELSKANSPVAQPEDQPELKGEVDSLTEKAGTLAAGTPTEGHSTADETVDDLRSRLASLFDLPLPVESASLEEACDETTSSSEERLSPEESVAEKSSEELTSVDEVLDHPTVATIAAAATEVGAVETSADPSSQLDAPTAEAPHASVEEDSVEDFMARLLARSRRESDSPPSEVPAARVHQSPSAPLQPQTSTEPGGLSESESSIKPTLEPTDRSHLTAEPKHKQNRDVVRENLQSFRQVAQLSARAALARHSSAQLRNAVIAKGILFSGSALAAASFFAAPLVGARMQIMNGVACCLAALLASLEFHRSWKQLRQPQQAARNADLVSAAHEQSASDRDSGTMKASDE